MIANDVAFVLVVFGTLAGAYRVVRGPGAADRSVASDLVFFGFIGLIVLLGLRSGSDSMFDLVLIATLVGFLATLSLARLVTRGKR